jgi:hypothetical protein
MRIGIFRAGLLAAIIALVGLISFGVPATAGTHAGSVQGATHAEHGNHATSAAEAAVDCADEIDLGSHSACCAASPFGCCSASLLIPLEAVATAPVGAPTFATASAEAPSGLPPGRLRKPPRR